MAVLLSHSAAPQQPEHDPRKLFEEAQHALLAHDYPRAEQGFRDVLRIDPQSVGGYANLGVVYMRTGRYDLAIEAIKKAKGLAPRMTGLDLNLGLAYYHKQDFAKAIPAFVRVLQSEPMHSQARYLLGVSYFMEGDYEHAV